MAKLVIENISLEQAEALAHWYEGQGEQDADVWLENNGLRSPLTDVGRKGGCIITEGDTVTLYCRSPKK